jgi:uncharacterized iron-regulated membrane protein
MLNTLLHHPRKLWLRRALFQVHLWLGILLSLYVVVISLSGATLVFEDEIRVASLPAKKLDMTRLAPLGTVIEQAQGHFPNWRLSFITPPQKESPRWELYLQDKNGKSKTIYTDPVTGVPQVHGGKLFIDWILELHVYLLMGHTGFVVDCAAGIGLLLLAITGAVLWWPGVALWKRALGVSLRSGWKRINYDLHSAVGIWTLFIVSWWGFTALCFLFPVQVTAAVNALSPLKGMKEPQVPEPEPSTAVASLESIVAQQPLISPGFLSSIGLPDKPGGKIVLYVDCLSPGDFSHRDIDTFDGHTGKILTVWHYGEKYSIGDWLLWLVYPLHFGTLWGLPVKILWASLGLSLCSLTITGLLMYWNRYLSARWRAIS